jgi:hypothetical protein
VLTISAPPPSPWIARNAISSGIPAQPARRRADEEDDQRRLEHELPAVDVAEFPGDRRRDRRGEQVGGDDPRQLLDPAEAADDRRQRGRDDRRVERREQHDQHQRREDWPHPGGGCLLTLRDGRRCHRSGAY